MSIIDSLITNRASGTYYNSTDLNRVGQAMQYIAGRIVDMGGSCVVNPKTDWSMQDIPTEAQMAEYLSDLATIRAAYAILQDTPAVPGSMEHLTYGTANAIERILHDVNALLVNAAAAWYYSGEIYGGEV